MLFPSKTLPFAHQQEAFELSADREAFAFLMEQGTGKSLPTAATVAYLYMTGKINGWVLAAPNGLHRKWMIEDIPMSLPDNIPRKIVCWQNSSAPVLRAFNRMIDSDDKVLNIFLINVEALSTVKGEELVKRFLQAHVGIFTIDESGRIKNPESKRTEKIVNLGAVADYRRILNGLPVSKSPFDLFSQFQFLDPRILGTSYFAFKNRHATFYEKDHPFIKNLMAKQARLTGRPSNRVPQIVAEDAQGNKLYKQLEKLKTQIAPYSYRKTKDECFDLPPKVYDTRFFQMTAKQRSHYDDVKENQRTVLDSELIIIQHKLSVQLRLQQITSGFMGITGEIEPRTICVAPEDNPRLMLLVDTLEDLDGSVIIWARFKPEVAMIKKVLGEKAVTWYGDTSATDKPENERAFKAGEVPYMIATASSGGIGRNWQIAGTSIYYSNSFDFEHRAQSEDRNHRYGVAEGREKVLYIDLQAEDSVDQDIVASLRQKKDLGEYMMNKDRPKQTWDLFT